jgi:hypothetical protein
MKKIVPFGGISLSAVMMFIACSCMVRSGSTDLALQAQLVWGTNNDKPEDSKLKEVDAKVTERLRTALKWKNYFEVNRQSFTVSAAQTKKVKMSDHCEIEVQYLGNSSVEAKLYGKGKMVVKKMQKLKPGELLIFAGDDKNDTAWFVVLSLVEK